MGREGEGVGREEQDETRQGRAELKCGAVLVAALHHCTCSLGCKRERGDACENARQEEASHLIESDTRFQLESIDVNSVKDGAICNE